MGKRYGTVPLYFPNAALVGEKRGKRDRRSEVMQIWFTTLSHLAYTVYDREMTCT